MRPLQTERLVIRNWQENDRALFHLINSDEQVMTFFPSRRTRREADELMNIWQDEIAETGLGLTAVALRDTDECIGFCGLHIANVMPFLPQETVEIGWRLAPQFWGKGYVTEAATRVLDYAFDDLKLPEIVAYAVFNNERSTAVMSRLGMTHDAPNDFDHPRVPDTHPQLKRHALYRLAAESWRQRKRPQ